jgi:hypothetical protein
MLVDEEALMQMLNLILNNTYEKLHPLKTHYPTIKTQKKFIYNDFVTIFWVLQLTCINFSKNMVY